MIVNSDSFSATDYDAVFKAVGLDALSYAPTSAVTKNTAWPSLGSMIGSGKRLVTFMNYHADFTAVPYIIDGGFYWLHLLLSDSSLTDVTLEFTNVWETAYDVTDTTFDCNVNRSNGDTTTELYVINHFRDTTFLNPKVLIPDRKDASVTNGVSGTGSLGVQVQTCVTAYGRNPNFMLVDVCIYCHA